jgi:hypothetical protein
VLNIEGYFSVEKAENVKKFKEEAFAGPLKRLDP